MRRIRIPHFVLLWAAAVLVLTAASTLYGVTPGKELQAGAGWPTATTLDFPQDIPGVVLFMHPRCPCTRATLMSLATVVREVGGPVSVQIVAFEPPQADSAWRNTASLELAHEVAGATVVHDAGGVEIARFSAKTSGEVFAYAPGGRLLFHGGLTASRGQEGPSRGADLLRQQLQDYSLPAVEWKTFGCALVHADAGNPE